MAMTNEPVVNWETTRLLHNLIQKLLAMDEQSYWNGMSDDFYHSNGGFARDRALIRRQETLILDLCPNIDLARTRILNSPHWHPYWQSAGLGNTVKLEI